jgi:hypothetical protein
MMDSVWSTMDQWWHGQEEAGAWRCAHRSLASGHSGARELTGEGAKERREHRARVSGLWWWCGDRATKEKLWQRGNSMVVVLDLGGRGKMRGGGAVNDSRGRLLL